VSVDAEGYHMKSQNKRTKIIFWTLIFLLGVFGAYTAWGNLTVGTTYYDLSFKNLPGTFDGFKIAQISDLHNAEFGKSNSKIISILKSEKPDIISITGDLVDSNRTDIDVAVNFAEEAIKIAPCYYVTGNHEAWLGATYAELENRLVKSGVAVLHDKMILLEKDNESIQLIGLDDPDFTYKGAYEQDSILGIKLYDMNLPQGFKLLLSHRPETFDVYVANDIDLVLSGHAHGGQFRLPFLGGIVAPNQGLLPKYDAGIFTESNTTMIVSRGIGNSIVPIRINNRPEVVIVRLHKVIR